MVSGHVMAIYLKWYMCPCNVPLVVLISICSNTFGRVEQGSSTFFFWEPNVSSLLIGEPHLKYSIFISHCLIVDNLSYLNTILRFPEIRSNKVLILKYIRNICWIKYLQDTYITNFKINKNKWLIKNCPASRTLHAQEPQVEDPLG